MLFAKIEQLFSLSGHDNGKRVFAGNRKLSLFPCAEEGWSGGP